MEKGNFNKIIQDSRPVIIDFHAEWCEPCKVQSPILKGIGSELGDTVHVIKIDVDKNPEIANRYNIQGVPTIMIFKDGVLKYRQSGVHDRTRLIGILETMES